MIDCDLANDRDSRTRTWISRVTLTLWQLETGRPATRAMSIQAFVFLHSLRALHSDKTILPAQPFKIFVGAEYAKHPLWKKVIALSVLKMTATRCCLS